MSAIRAFATRRAPFAFAQRAAFSQSIARTAGKESALHSENRAEEIEKKKQEQLNKKKDGKQHWEEQLASDSESAVKADRSETGKDTKEQIKELQEETKKVGQ
ncbi:hypothetical protein J4E91_006536 [Alternaria rosae]|uniref:uncharacterized protein n=1 Tax=Alternaria rosae TaxID=1187941 RepID=UPI001E8CEFB3|nr:uncharacterized protein BKA58DRAFT_391902 [Alternaria rosae]KAH6860648.1 hypothetical protein BKA58DRAFT_391902 [Alternaria rosae]KAI4947714.1 hypothetical protein J4E91_006536 [Alternaria rosae]